MTTPARQASHARQFLTGGFCLLALVVAMAVFFAARQRHDNSQARVAMLASNQLSDVLSTVRQAESGLRGYMLTRNPASFDTYVLALRATPREIARLQGYFPAGDPDLADVQSTVATKLTQLAQVAAIFQSGDVAGAVAQVNAALNLGTMQHLRDVVTRMQTAQNKVLAADGAGDERNGWILQIATGLAVAGTLLLGWFAIRDNRDRTNALLAAEAALKAINDALELKIVERTASIAASETKFRTLAETMLGLVFLADEMGLLTYVNNSFAAYANLPVEAMLGHGWGQVVHPDDLPGTVAAWTESLTTHRPYEVEFRLRRHDGAYLWYFVRGLPIYDESRRVIGWIGNGLDIEERKQAEASMLDLNALLEQRVAERTRELDRIFNLSTDLLTVNDFEGNFLAVSPAWEQITGWPMKNAMGQPFLPMVHPDDEDKTKAVFESEKLGQPVTAFENRYKRADGTYCWLSWRAVPVLEEQRIYSIARDVTQEKARDEQLRQSQKMEVVGQLTGGIAHDFNNLLTIIMGSLEMLQRGLPEADAKTTRRIEAAMDGGKRAAALTHRLLAFARRQPLEPKPVEPNRLVAGMADMLHRVLGEQIALEFVSAAGLWRAQADVNQLENCILNLAVNARDAMPEGGQLTIETGNVHLDETYTAERADVEPGQYVLIAITDNGTGMTPEVREKVFEPFFTTKPQGAGTGLGLAQVYGFIRQSNGHVAIYSEPGHGTAVKLYLPRLRGAAPAEEPGAATAPLAEARSRGETILVVEDEENVRNFSIEVLEDYGYRVLATENAAGAFKILDSGAAVNMMFTDVILTGAMNGRQLADEFMRRRPEAAVLFTTGYTRNAIIHHGRLDDGIDFIGKPFTATALTQIVRRILDREPATLQA